MRRRCLNRSYSFFSLVLVVSSGMLLWSGPGFAAGSVLDSPSDTSFFSQDVRPLASTPPLESLVPMPLNINPFNRRKVRESCLVQVIKRTAAVKGAKGTFTAQLMVMSEARGTFVALDLGSGKFKTDRDGRVAFDFDIPTDLFAEGFKQGDISAWAHSRVEFTKRKGTYASLRCDIAARK